MPETAITGLPTDIQRLIEIVETTMHHIVRGDMSRDQAIEVRHRFSRPLGLLIAKHDLNIRRPKLHAIDHADEAYLVGR